MSVIPEEYLERLQWFSEHVQRTLDDDKLVQKGLHLFQQGAVSQIKLEHEEVLAVVQDVTLVKVILDLDIPSLSECSCPAEGMCRHQIAAFLQLLSYEGSVSTWIEEWRQKQPISQWEVSRAKDLLKSTKLTNPSYENWKTIVNESFHVILYGKGEPKAYFVNDLFSIYLRKLKTSAPIEKEWKNLYMLITSVFSFIKLAELSAKLQHEEHEVNRYYRHLFQELIDTIEMSTAKMSVQSVPFAFDEYIQKLRNDAKTLLFLECHIDYDRIHLYRLLWTRVFKETKWREEESDQLEEHSLFTVRVARIHLYFLTQKDEKAHIVIRSLDDELAPYFFYWLEQLHIQREWKRMNLYIQEFVARLKSYLSRQFDYYVCREFVSMATRAIAPYCVEHHAHDVYEKALLSMLPYSYHDLDYFLFEKGSYEKWIELQIYSGFDMTAISKEKMKKLQTECPDLLLPLYHQAIQTNIDAKSRDQYKQAVRKLKKLRTLYKKLKRMDEWNSFLDLLLTRTKRLRAFQEECKRGKLIDA